ncbi:MAG: riboflavin synthase [Planctomycetota bacterium]
MFTGIVERTARVSAVEDRPGRRVITVEVDSHGRFPEWSPAQVGESISVSGVCLTVVRTSPRSRGEAVSFDAVPKTLGRTTLGALRAGHTVNIERALRAGDRFGGHYVTGHVDGVGVVRARKREGDQVLFEIAVTAEILREVVPKGSVAVDGVSLTVVDADRAGGRFTFAAIPHTLSWTTLGERAPGDKVNVETDAFAKYVLHALGLAGTPGAWVRPADATGSRDERLRSLIEGWGQGGGPGG